MKEYKKPIIEEEKIELEDIIAASSTTKIAFYDGEDDDSIWGLLS